MRTWLSLSGFLAAAFAACAVGGFFFGLRRPGWALGEIVLLWLLLAWLLGRFWTLDRWAGVLWAPYVIWVGFATGLNFAIWRLNAA